MNPSAVIGVQDLADRFHLSIPSARALLRREMPYFQVGRRLYTTEALLAQWMASKVKNPPPPKFFDPLEAAVAERAGWLIRYLVDEGKLAVVAATKSA